MNAIGVMVRFARYIAYACTRLVVRLGHLQGRRRRARLPGIQCVTYVAHFGLFASVTHAAAMFASIVAASVDHA